MKRKTAFPTAGSRFLALLALVASLGMGLMPMTVNAAPFSNGSFETPVVGGSAATFVTGNSIGPWTVATGEVDIFRGAVFTPAEGMQVLDLEGRVGFPRGGLCQTFDTVVGASYKVNFALSHNFTGSSSATAAVFIDNVFIQAYVHNAPATAANPGWEPHSTPFTATTTATSLCFLSAASTNLGFGPVIDDVSVEEIGVCTAPPPSMIAWLPGDGNGNDLTGNGHNGTPSSGVTFADGMVGQAFQFSGGANEVVVPDDNALDVTTAITLDAWVFPQVATGRIVDKIDAGGTTGYSLDLFPAGVARVILGTPGSGGVLSTTANAVLPNVWTHLAATYDGATIRLYVNGVLNNSIAHSGPIPVNSMPVRLGNSAANVANTRFTGLIDEVEIFDRALSGAEIQAIVAAASAGKCKNTSDLGITKTASSPALPGTTITFTFKVQNFGPDTAPGYTVVDTVPASITNVASSTPGCSVAGNTVTCVGGPIANGEIDTILITGTTPTNAPTTVGNTVSLSTLGLDPTPGNNSSTSTSTVDFPAGICRGTSLRLLGALELGTANPAAIPCATATNTVLSVNQPLPTLGSSVKAGVITGTSTRGSGLAAATATIAKVDVIAIGLVNLSVTGITSQAKSQAVAGCGTAVVSGASKIAGIRLTVLGLPVFVPIGSNPVSLPLLVGGLFLNQKVITGSTITQRALFLDLPGTLLDVVIGETTAGIGC